MKKKVLMFLIASFLYTVNVNAAGLIPQREVKTLLELSVRDLAPQLKITDIIKNGFYNEKGQSRYYIKGRSQKGFLELDGEKYYFDEEGNMVTGQKKIGNAQYYFDSNGIMQTGFVKMHAKTYYYDKKTGEKLFGFHKIGDYKYYFKKNTGEMVTGFHTRESGGSKIKTYYNSSGQLKTGTFRVSNVEYKASPGVGKIYSVKNLAKTVCQRPELPTGCEITSWTMMADYADIQMDKIQAANIMPRSSDPNQGFVGSPYSSSGGSLVIYPGGLKGITKKYFGSYVDMTGYSLEKIKQKLWSKHLVMIWVTRLDGFGSHTVALTGYDQDNFFYNDPWTGGEGKISSTELNVIWGENAYRAMSY